jgi:glycosyltransferase involved in cell wall biosynthesis
MLLSVIMPCYNEAATISSILAKVREVALEKQIIAVDDNSSDNT